MGNYKNAYLNKRPNPVDPSAWINKQEEIGMYHSELKRKREQEEADKLNKTFEGDFDGEYDMSSSGNGTIDGMLMQIGMQSLAELKQAKEIGEQAIQTHGANSKEYIEARQRYDNILKRPSLLKLATNDFNGALSERQEQLATGNYYQDHEDLKKLNNISSTPLKWKSMPDGRILINSGETTADIQDFAGSLKLGKLIQKVDENAVMQTVAGAFKDKTTESRDGYETTKRVNTWEDSKDETGNKMFGAKTYFTRQYEDIVDDEFARSVLAGQGKFDYNSMSDEDKDTLKANIVNGMVENSRPLIKESLEKDFDSSKYRADLSKGGNNSGGSGNGGSNLGFLKSEGGKDSWSFTFTEKGANKSAQAGQFNKITMDNNDGVIYIDGKLSTGKSYDEAKISWDLAKDALAEAVKASLETKDENGEKKTKEQKQKDLNAIVEKEALVDKTSKDLNKLDSWEKVTLNSKDDDAEVLRILMETLDIKTLDEARKKLSKGSVSTNTETNDLPDIDALPDL